ncbi:MAG TPA: hypothetical protein VF796_01160 [Humisphaera sp.]
MRARTLVLAVVAIATLTLCGDAARGIGFVMGETKEELKLKYGVAVEDHGTGRVTVVLTLADEGRLKPLDEVQFVIPSRATNPDGSHWMDLVVAVDLHKAGDGTRVGRVHLLKEWGERDELQLNTHTLDGKLDPLTRLHHVIPVARYMKPAPPTAATTAPATRPAMAPPATDRR